MSVGPPGPTGDGTGPAEVAYVYDPRLADWQLAEDHPFKPVRLELVTTLLRAWGLLSDDALLAPARVRTSDLERAHTSAYVDTVKRVSRGEEVGDAFRFGLGTVDTPIAEGLHRAVADVCGGTIAAMDAILDGTARRAASFSGGLHHAMSDRASGFCIYNDLVLAILRATDRGQRVAYVDLDAHHGDGVQAAFYERGDVLTLSMHESGRYLFPGSGHAYEIGTGHGRGAAVNVPLEPFTEDASYLEAFDLVVPAALRAHQPDVIVLQAGVDTHHHDPLADLSLTIEGMHAAVRRMVGLADTLCEGRLLVTGGGGYDAWRTAPRAWAAVYAAMLGVEVPASTPPSWREAWRARAPFPLPERSMDGPTDFAPQPRRLLVRGHNLAVARRLVKVLTPIWEARDGAQHPSTEGGQE